MTLLPVAWADYFGRDSYGAIRGVALTLQVLAQASGPLISGVLRDRIGRLPAVARLLRGVIGAQRGCGAAGASAGTPPACRDVFSSTHPPASMTSGPQLAASREAVAGVVNRNNGRAMRRYPRRIPDRTRPFAAPCDDTT